MTESRAELSPTVGRRRPLTVGPFFLAAPALAVIIVLVAIPLVEMVEASFRQQEYGLVIPGVTLQNYREILLSGPYLELFYKTAFTALAVTIACLCLGFPVAIHLASAPPQRKPFLYFLIVAPLLVNTVVRSYGWLLMLGNRGVLNQILGASGFAKPIALTGNSTGVIIGATQVFLPFMILSLATSLDGVDRRLLEAAEILGAGRVRRFTEIIVPLTFPGIIAGSVLVFSLMLGAIVTPLMLGGSAIRFLSVAIYTDALVLFDLPRATALSVVLLLAVVALYALQRRYLRGYNER